jgi:hypothetical protein
MADVIGDNSGLLHCNTLSNYRFDHGVSISGNGTVSPRDFAVLRLNTNSTFRFFTFENTAGVDTRLTSGIHRVSREAHETTGNGSLSGSEKLWGFDIVQRAQQVEPSYRGTAIHHLI